MALRPGQEVEVRTRFDGTWASGFDIEESVGDGYLVRRASDGEVLPVVIHEEEIRTDD